MNILTNPSYRAVNPERVREILQFMHDTLQRNTAYEALEAVFPGQKNLLIPGGIDRFNEVILASASNAIAEMGGLAIRIDDDESPPQIALIKGCEGFHGETEKWLLTVADHSGQSSDVKLTATEIASRLIGPEIAILPTIFDF